MFRSLALLSAAEKGDVTRVRTLLDTGANANSRRILFGMSALNLASLGGHKEVAELLIAKGGDVNMGDRFSGMTALQRASLAGHKEVVELLIGNGADVDTKDRFLGQTALARACVFGHADVAQCLIEAGADVDTRDKKGKTPLHHAAYELVGHPWPTQQRRGASGCPYAAGCPAEAIKLEVVRLLLANGASVDAREDTDGATPLAYATMTGHREVMKLLVAGGADVSARGNNGATTLHNAAIIGSCEAVELLIASGADVDAKNNDGVTPLYNAASRGHYEVVKLLVAKGADVQASASGVAPADIAARRRHNEIAQFLAARPRKSKAISDLFSGPAPTVHLRIPSVVCANPPWTPLGLPSDRELAGPLFFTDRGVLFIATHVGPRPKALAEARAASTEGNDLRQTLEEGVDVLFIPRATIKGIRYTWAFGFQVGTSRGWQAFLLEEERKTYQYHQAQIDKYLTP
jgi:ankyrin repeat protein